MEAHVHVVFPQDPIADAGRHGRGAYVPSGEAAPAGFAVSSYRFKAGLEEDMRAARLVISHAGSGSIFEALALCKPLIVVVNEALMDNHQAELADARTEALREEIKSEMTTTLKESMSDMRKLLETQLREELAEMKRALARERSTPSQTSSVIQREWPLRASPPGSESGESPGSLVFTPDQNAARSEGEFTLNNASNQDVSSSGEVNFFSARQPQTRPSRPFADAKTNDLTDPPHPGKFMDILQMIESGTTPPGIKDIDDAPPNPDITIPRSSSSRP